MLDIYICEDNKKQLSLFTGYIRDALLIENLDMQIVLASSDPDEILEGMKASSNMGVFFLDIDLKSRINGLTLAQEIRKLQPRCFIIFITSHSEMGFLTFQYKVEPLDFIIKSRYRGYQAEDPRLPAECTGERDLPGKQPDGEISPPAVGPYHFHRL